MTKTYLFVGATALMMGLALALPAASQAYKGDPNVKGPNYSVERHDAMIDAFKRKDYTTWKKLMEGKGAVNRITAANFDKFVEAHNLALQGRTAEANQIKSELGLGQQNGTGKGQGFGRTRQ